MNNNKDTNNDLNNIENEIDIEENKVNNDENEVNNIENEVNDDENDELKENLDMGFDDFKYESSKNKIVLSSPDGFKVFSDYANEYCREYYEMTDDNDLENLKNSYNTSVKPNMDSLELVDEVIIINSPEYSMKLEEFEDNKLYHHYEYTDAESTKFWGDRDGAINMFILTLENLNLYKTNFYSHSSFNVSYLEDIDYIKSVQKDIEKNKQKNQDTNIDKNLKKVLSDDLQFIVKDGKIPHAEFANVVYINRDLDIKQLLYIYREVVLDKLFLTDGLRLPRYLADLAHEKDFLTIICKKSKEDIKIQNEDYNSNKVTTWQLRLITNKIRDIINSNVAGFLRKNKVNPGILDYIESKGIEIKDLVEAGMELVVGVDENEENLDEIRRKLYQQILISLNDLNIITLIMAAFRVEEDLLLHRISEVDVDDDPAQLFTDEVFGLAIANHIAGTKAIFNFKRYDEEKPGILKELPPMTDDVFAGLIAGCMSKIFEDD
ncbi:MAG: phosphatidylglycerophosphatase A [Methanobrevibacter sp.]|jgi:alpha-ribazole phosphatase CobZ|nr:phosphatidylglycerophosphatase A [Candidatus Methanoflexus mossambicus]